MVETWVTMRVNIFVQYNNSIIMSENKRHILIVEDDTFVRDVYTTRLEKEGYKISLAMNGREAMEQLEDVIPDVVLLDITMPYMDGMEVLRALHTKKRIDSMAVLMLTNNSEKENVQEAMKLGARGYIIKSHFTPSEIVGKVSEVLEKMKQEGEVENEKDEKDKI